MTPLRMMKTGETWPTTWGQPRSVFMDGEGRRWVQSIGDPGKWIEADWHGYKPMPALAAEARSDKP